MRVLVQRSQNARCVIDCKVVGQSSKGLVLFVGFTEGDSLEQIIYMVNKILHLRIFPDEKGVMNQSILEQEGVSILSISQFTLYADTSKGNRPSYLKSLNSEQACFLYEQFNQELAKYIPVETGVFGKDMQIELTNIGPTTIWLER